MWGNGWVFSHRKGILLLLPQLPGPLDVEQQEKLVSEKQLRV